VLCLAGEAGGQPAHPKHPALSWLASGGAPLSPSAAPVGEGIPDKLASNGDGHFSCPLFFIGSPLLAGYASVKASAGCALRCYKDSNILNYDIHLLHAYIEFKKKKLNKHFLSL